MQPIFNAVPKAITTILLANVIIHLMQIFTPVAIFNAVLEILMFIPARYSLPNGMFDNITATIVSPIGYSFVHANWNHLILNMMFLVPFGTVICHTIKIRYFLVLYFAGAGIAALTHFVLFSTSLTPMIGASGATSALVGYIASAGVLGYVFQSPFHIQKNIITFTAVWAIINVAIPYFTSDSVAWDAHLGGFALGFIVFGVFKKLRIT